MDGIQTTELERTGVGTMEPLRRGLRLRICGTERDGQILRISAPRCTFGGAPTCTVRLQSPGIRPVHCLIVNEGGLPKIRSLSPGNRLNNAPFHEAHLRFGDRLRLGAIEFEVLASVESLPAQPAQASEPVPASQSGPVSGSVDVIERIERLEQQLAVHSDRIESSLSDESEATLGFHRSIEQLTRQIADERSQRLADQQQWNAERDRLNLELARSADELSNLANELALHQQLRAEAEQRHLQLSDQLTELEAAKTGWAREREAMLAEHRQTLEDAARVQRQIEEELAASREQLAEIRDAAKNQESCQAEWDGTRERLEQERQQLRQTMEEYATQIAEIRHEQEREQQRWEEERNTLVSELNDRESRLQQRQGECRDLQETLQNDRVQLEAALQQEQTARKQTEEEHEQQRTKCEALEWRLDEYEALVTELRDKCAELESVSGNAPGDPTVVGALDELHAKLQETLEEERREFHRERAEWDEERTQLLEQLRASQESEPSNEGCASSSFNVPENATESWEMPAAIAPTRPLVETPVSMNPDLSREDASVMTSEQPTEPAHSLPQASELEMHELYNGESADRPTTSLFDYSANTSSEESEQSPSSSEHEEESRFTGLFSDRYREQESEETCREQESEEPCETAVESGTTGAPVSTVDVLARLGHAGIWRDDEEDSTPSQESPRPFEMPVQEPVDEPKISPPNNVAPINANARGSHDEGDEESIEAYMSRLLQRVSGTPADRQASVPSMEATGTSEPITEVPMKPQESEEFSPRRQAPEQLTNLAAMRAVANDSARSALATYADRNWFQQAKVRVGIGLLVLVGVIAGTVYFADNLIVLGGGTITSVIIVTLLAYQVWSLRKRLFASMALELPADSSDPRSRKSGNSDAALAELIERRQADATGEQKASNPKSDPWMDATNVGNEADEELA